MGKFKDLTGRKFGKLTVLKYIGKDKHNNSIWLCKCDCGNEIEAIGTRLNCNKIKSCGCLIKERATQGIHTTHKLTNTRLYKVWYGIKGRCCNKRNNSYKYYGLKGIKVCDEWKNDFQAFYDWAIKNGYNPNAKRGDCTIDRIDVNGNYEPDNCRFIENKKQCRNRTNNNLITYNNETHCLIEWSEILKIPYYSLNYRLKSGWTTEKAFTTVNPHFKPQKPY